MPPFFAHGPSQVIDPSKPVRVFKNWRHDCYSIMQNGRLKASAKQVRLTDVEFLVRESGRQRMLEQRRKNVHAYAVGRLMDYAHPAESRNLEELPGRGVYYNPYEFASFVDRETQAPVISASVAHFVERGGTYSNHD